MQVKKIFFIIFINIISQEKVIQEKIIKVSAKVAKRIGQQIYINECAGDLEKLVFWKPGEDFVSVGIGHFIWCSKDRCSFVDSFPELRAFLIANKVKIPKEFLDKSPWHSQEELKADRCVGYIFVWLVETQCICILLNLDNLLTLIYIGFLYFLI